MPAITDQSIVPYPATPPDAGQAGSIIIDPFCGSQMLRITDADTSSGVSWATHAASESNPWAADSSTFAVLNRKTGGFWRFSFDADNFAASSLGPIPLGGIEFSWSNPDLIWGFSDLKIQQLSISSGKITTLIDMRQHPEIGIPASPRWYLNALSADYWDHRCSVNLGPQQNQNYILIVYDIDWGLDWLNTQTGQHEGWWGKSQLADWVPCVMHDSRISKGGTVVRTSLAQNPNKIFWRPGTPTYESLASSPATPMAGHTALGFNTYYGANLNTVPFQFIAAPFWNMASWQNLMNPVPKPVSGWWSDYHISIRPLGGDRHPIFVSAYNAQGNPKTSGTALTASAPGDNEIFAVATDLTGHWWRHAHHYSTGQGNFYAQPHGNISPDGRFFLFTSDWYMGLGGTYPNQRTDVFILKIDQS